MKTDLAGELAESIAILHLIVSGYVVSRPVNKCRYDLLVDKDGVISKIQVKKGMVSDDYITFRTASITAGGKKRKQYTSEEIDYFLVVDVDNEITYMIGVGLVSKGSQRLRLTPTKNSQSKGILLAKDFLLRE